MLFTLELIPAGHGDCFLLHYGSGEEPHQLLVDGGPPGTYRASLGPRLDALGKAQKKLVLELVVAGHSDESHIAGLVDLTRTLVNDADNRKPPRFQIAELWHNSFDALMGRELLPESAPHPRTRASWRHKTEDQYLGSQGLERELRKHAERLCLIPNRKFEEEIVSSRRGVGVHELRGGLRIQVLGPYPPYINDLRLRLERAGDPRTEPSFLGEMGTFSSIYFLASLQGKTILFTGDARGDHILAGLDAQGLLEKRRIHVDVLKVPNHGSGHNVDTNFYRTVTADHYVISANGRYDNPDLAVIQMILSARTDEPFDLYFSYPPEELIEGYPIRALKTMLHEAKKRGARFRVHVPPRNGLPMGIVLLEPHEALGIVDQHSPQTLWSPHAGARVFVSYHHGDSKIAADLADALEQRGFDVWKADAKLKPGTPAWARSIEQALDSSQCVVVVLSPGAKQSDWVRREIYYADLRKLPIIPVVVAGNDQDAVPVELSHLQRVTARDPVRFEEAVAEVAHGLEQALIR